jgi:hypothetical protein
VWDRLACCPPGPPDVENETCSSWRGIRTERVTGRTSSTQPDCHDLRSNRQGRPRLPRGARRGRPGDATVVDRGWASTCLGGGQWRAPSESSPAGNSPGTSAFVTQSPAGPGLRIGCELRLIVSRAGRPARRYVRNSCAGRFVRATERAAVPARAGVTSGGRTRARSSRPGCSSTRSPCR